MTDALAIPADEAAEAAVLGAVLLSRQALEDVIGIVNPDDFYTPRHQEIFAAATTLFTDGKPVDPLLLSDALNRAGALTRTGGVTYLHTLAQNTISTASASFYAARVAETARLRRLQEHARRLVAATSTPGADANEVFTRAYNDLDEINTQTDATRTLAVAARESFTSTIMHLEELEKGEAKTGIDTGFPDLDHYLAGLRPGQLITIGARPGVGKALALNTPIPTPTPAGYTPMGELTVGDRVYTRDGTTTSIVAVTEPMDDRECFAVTIEGIDGTPSEVIVADAEHLWMIRTPTWGIGGRVWIVTTATVRAHMETHPVWVPSTHIAPARRILSIEPVASVPVRCIQVDRPDGMFLAGVSGVPTHNSTIAMDICRNATLHEGKTALYFTLEMAHSELMMRVIAAHCQVEFNRMRSGTMDDQDWERIAARSQQINNANLFIDDTPTITPADIKARARRIQSMYGLDLIAVDYVQLMSSGKQVESRQQEVAQFARSMKLLAKELHVPVIMVSQLNRGLEGRSDKRPTLTDLRESGAIEQDSDVVLLLHREGMTDEDSPRAGEADVIIAKQRSGPTGVVPLAFLGQYARFASLAA